MEMVYYRIISEKNSLRVGLDKVIFMQWDGSYNILTFNFNLYSFVIIKFIQSTYNNENVEEKFSEGTHYYYKRHLIEQVLPFTYC